MSSLSILLIFFCVVVVLTFLFFSVFFFFFPIFFSCRVRPSPRCSTVLFRPPLYLLLPLVLVPLPFFSHTRSVAFRLLGEGFLVVLLGFFFFFSRLLDLYVVCISRSGFLLFDLAFCLRFTIFRQMLPFLFGHTWFLLQRALILPCLFDLETSLENSVSFIFHFNCYSPVLFLISVHLVSLRLPNKWLLAFMYPDFRKHLAFSSHLP